MELDDGGGGGERAAVDVGVEGGGAERSASGAATNMEVEGAGEGERDASGAADEVGHGRAGPEDVVRFTDTTGDEIQFRLHSDSSLHEYVDGKWVMEVHELWYCNGTVHDGKEPMAIPKADQVAVTAALAALCVRAQVPWKIVRRLPRKRKPKKIFSPNGGGGGKDGSSTRKGGRKRRGQKSKGGREGTTGMEGGEGGGQRDAMASLEADKGEGAAEAASAGGGKGGGQGDAKASTEAGEGESKAEESTDGDIPAPPVAWLEANASLDTYAAMKLGETARVRGQWAEGLGTAWRELRLVKQFEGVILSDGKGKEVQRLSRADFRGELLRGDYQLWGVPQKKKAATGSSHVGSVTPRKYGRQRVLPGRHRSLSRADGLFLLLYWMRTGVTLVIAAATFGVSHATASRVRDEHLACLYYLLLRMCPFPTREQFRSAYPDWLTKAANDPHKRLCAIIDCLGWGAQTPSEPQLQHGLRSGVVLVATHAASVR